VADSHENYGRCLASLRFGGNFFGQETEDFGDKMLEAGHAVLYGKNKAVFMP
jgi:endonuclease YncB( thermonuclease family)